MKKLVFSEYSVELRLKKKISNRIKFNLIYKPDVLGL